MQDTKGLNIDAIVAELDNEFSQDTKEVLDPEANPEEQDTIEENVEAPEEVVEAEEVDEEEEYYEEDEEEAEEETPDIMDEDLHKRNAAFKELREERDRLAASDKFLSDLASQYGLSKEQLMERFTQQQQEKLAKEQGIDPAQYRKMQELEAKVQQIEEDKHREVFNVRAEAFQRRYDLTEDALMEVFTEAGKLGLDITKNPTLLEVVYRSINFDKAIETGRQKQLETSKRRSKTSVGKTGTQGADVNTTEADWEKEIDEVLKKNYITK